MLCDNVLGGFDLLLLRNTLGDTALDLANKEGNTPIADLLQSFFEEYKNFDQVNGKEGEAKGAEIAVVNITSVNPVLGCFMRTRELDGAKYNNTKVRVLGQMGDRFRVGVCEDSEEQVPFKQELTLNLINLAPHHRLAADGPPGKPQKV
jgi:hypothetical protein